MTNILSVARPVVESCINKDAASHTAHVLYILLRELSNYWFNTVGGTDISGSWMVLHTRLTFVWSSEYNYRFLTSVYVLSVILLSGLLCLSRATTVVEVGCPWEPPTSQDGWQSWACPPTTTLLLLGLWLHLPSFQCLSAWRSLPPGPQPLHHLHNDTDGLQIQPAGPSGWRLQEDAPATSGGQPVCRAAGKEGTTAALEHSRILPERKTVQFLVRPGSDVPHHGLLCPDWG